MAKLPDFTPMLHRQAKDGYRTSSVELLERLIACLRENGQFTDAERGYLLECLENTLACKPEDANKGFYLSYPRGKQKADTVMRDFYAARLMYFSDKPGIGYEDRLKMAAEQVNLDFKAAIDVKTVEKAYTQYKDEILRYLHPEDCA